MIVTSKRIKSLAFTTTSFLPHQASKHDHSLSNLSPRRPRTNYSKPNQFLLPVRMENQSTTTTSKSSSSTIITDKTLTLRSNIPKDKNPVVRISLKAEDLGSRRRKVSGTIDIESTVSRVWQVITSYNQIQSYMPNILESRMYTKDNNVYLDQVGVISNTLGLKSKMIVKVDEDYENQIVTFTKFQGRDFQEFEGKFFVRKVDQAVKLDYQLTCIPFFIFPLPIVERKIIKEIPKMLAAIREEAILGKHIQFDK